MAGGTPAVDEWSIAMKNNKDSNRLSWGDALFLYLEREGMPLNIASVSVFEGDIPLDACTQSIASRLPFLPRYYQRVVTPPWNIGLPSWEDDPQFDIRNHIREVTLKRGTEAELKALAGKILGTVMNRKRPLWDITLVHGLQGNRSAMVLRIHHCLADGIAGVGLMMNVLLDPSPEPRLLPKKKHSRRRRRPQPPATRFLDGWISSYSDILHQALTAHSDMLSIGERMAASGGEWPSREIARFLPELTAPPERLFFNVTYQGPQKFAWAKIPLAEIKAIRERCGGTHNDVVLALITATIRRYAELHGDKVRRRLLRMMVPVSVRGNGNATELGNRISLLPVNVPLGIRNPRRLLAAVQKRMEFLKRRNVAELVGLAGELVGLVPAPLQAVVGPFISVLPITPFNLVCTNIRGPQTPLYLLGHKMLDWYPYVPIGGEMTVNCAILSYNDVSYFGFSGDAQAAPDLGRLETFLKMSFEELRQAAGIRPPRPNKATKTKPVLARQPTTPIHPTVLAPVPIVKPEPSQRPAAEKEHQPAAMAAD
jgi:diacylglycerol O-acyltransferase / wax synthase